MATTYTAVPANVTLSAAPTETLPSDGDPLAVGGLNPTLQKLLDFIANLSNLILNGFTATLKLANQATTLLPAGNLTTVTLGAGWSGGTVRYWKDTGGVVHIVGGASFATGGSTTAFTLPVGFRPVNATRYFPCAGATAVTTVAVVTDGTVITVTTPANGTFVDFSAIHFPAEQ